MNAELKKRHEELMKEFRSLNIRPKMELITTEGKPQGTFDLRSLNQGLISKSR